MIYMDNAATTPLSEAAAQAYINTAKEHFCNPSSHYQGGYETKAFLQKQREEIASLIGAKPYEVYFTSGGSESNNWALDVIAREGVKTNHNHIISSAIEHHSVLNKLKQLQAGGFEVTFIKPQSDGLIKASDIIDAIRPTTCGISLMAVNNELGTIQPIKEIGAECKKRNILFHVDAVQALPHMIFNLEKMNINYLSASGHKFEGPRGCGFLYVKKGSPISPLIFGGAQENNVRAGTENVPAIAAMAAALTQRVEIIKDKAIEKELAEKQKLLKERLSQIKGCHIFESPNAIPTVVNFYFEDVLGEVLLSLLNTDRVYCSVGSACAAGDPDPSHVLIAIGYSQTAAKNSIRLSFDYKTTKEEIEQVARAVQMDVDFARGI